MTITNKKVPTEKVLLTSLQYIKPDPYFINSLQTWNICKLDLSIQV